MPAKDINKIQALKDEAFVEGDVDEDFLERFAEETGWKSVLLYQYLSGYIVMIAMTALITTAIAWLELMHSIVTPYPTDEQMSEGNFLQSIVYIFDCVYFIDIIFRILYAITRWPNKKLYNEPVSIEFIFLDIVSVIPSCLLYSAVQKNTVIIAIMRLRVMIRLYRIPTAISTLKKMFHQISVVSTVLWSIALMLLCAIIPASLHYIVWCKRNGSCEFRDYKSFMSVYSVASRCLLTDGADIDIFHVDFIFHVYSILSVIYFMFTMYIVAELACKSIDNLKPRYCFIYEYEKTMRLYKAMKEAYKDHWKFEDDQIYTTLKDYYYHYLRQRNGITALKVLHKILPSSLSKNIIMDMAFDSFRHSHIFRNLELNIVRFLSTLVKFEFAVPGQVIVHKGDTFNKMIYISHGVLQILSHEDGETPVLNLSGGTSLGETTLFITYSLKCTIICQTYCELVILEKSDFKEMIVAYPTEYRELVKNITQRFEDAKGLRKIVHERMDPNLIKSDLLIMSWIKQFQRCFLHDREGEGTSLDSKIRGLQYYIDNLIFYVSYLDKMVVSEEIELVKDSVFLKSSYHFILQPQSPILIVWNVVVLILAIMFIITYPFNLCYPMQNKSIQTVYTVFVTFIFWIDIYLQMFTAVRTRGATYLTFKTIIVYRIRQKEFLIDCAAALPLEYFIMFLSGKIPDVVFMLLQANRLLKYYKINCFFEELNIWSTDLLTAINYLKYVIHYLFFYYYAAMITFILNCFNEQCTEEFNEIEKYLGTDQGYYKLWSVIPMSSALVTGVIIGKLPYTTNALIFLGYTIVSILAYLLHTLFLVNVISSTSVNKYPLLKQQEKLLEIVESMDLFDVTKSYKNGIGAYLNTLFFFNSDIYFHFNNMILPKELGASFRNVHLGRILSRNKFFMNLPGNMISHLTSYVKMVIIPAGLVVFYCGQAIDEFYIIQHGFCTMWYGTIKKDVTINENLGLVEVLLGVPIFHTIVTRTDCILMKISKQDLQRFLHIFDKQSELVFTALHEFAKCEHLLSRKTEQIQESMKELFTEEMLFKLDSKEEIDAHDKNKVTFKMKVAAIWKKVYTYRLKVIPTTGKFCLYWEFTKNIALVNGLFVTGTAMGATHRGEGYSFFIFLLYLDIFSFMDIFIRMLITYYDKYGLEVEKKSKTMIHYLSHSFIIDLIGAFPFDLFFTTESLFLTRLNRFVLTYRIFGLSYYLTNRIERVHQYVVVVYMLVMVAFIRNVAIYYLTVKCVYENEEYFCEENFWGEISTISNSWDHWYADSTLFLLSIFVGIGFRRYNIIHFWERIMLTLWGIAGNILVVIFVGRAVSYYLFRNADLTTYQEAMRDLVRFMSYCDIDKNIKNEVIQHFEYIWEKREGKDIANVISNFPTSVKKDLLFNIYGQFLQINGSAFKMAEDNFLKSLLMIAKQETYRKTGIIYKIDDIHGKIFFLLKGHVEVVGPDNNRLASLSAGSLFGCLDNCNESRQTLTMVAKGHVETLSFPSSAFYTLLNQHPKFYSRFYSLANMHFDYIPSVVVMKHTKRQSKYDTRISKQIIVKMRLAKFRTKILKPSKHFLNLQLALYIFEFFIGTILELSMLILFENTALLVITYLRDLLWWIRMYFKFHIAFEDEFGMLEYRRKKIAKRYIHQKDGFYFDLFCVIPLECLVFLISWTNIDRKANLFLLLRLNRLGRVFYLFRYMSKQTKRLNINVLVMRIANTLMYAFIYNAAKFKILYWCGTLLMKNRTLSSWHHIQEALNFADTICFTFSSAPVPHMNTFDKLSPSAICFIICVDTCVQVFFFCSFAGILQITTKVKSKYLSICHNLKLLMLICDASPPLIDKVQMYTNVLLRIRNGNQFPFLLERAPYYLREAVLNSMFGFHLRNHFLFKDCHVDFLRQLSATMRTLTYFEGNHICDKGDIDATMYFIQEGVVLALTKDTLYTEICEHLLVAGESFGLNQILYPHCGQYYSYRTSVLTTLVTIRRNEFVRLLTFFPSVKKHIYNRTMEFAS